MPGLLTRVMPCFNAKPLRGRICASKPIGNAMAIPVGISRRAIGAKSHVAVDIGAQIHAGGAVGHVSRQR